MNCEICNLIFDDGEFEHVSFIVFCSEKFVYVKNTVFKDYLFRWNTVNFDDFPYLDICVKCFENLLNQRLLSIVNYNYKNCLKDDIFFNFENGYIINVNPTFLYRWYSKKILENFIIILENEKKIIEKLNSSFPSF